MKLVIVCIERVDVAGFKASLPLSRAQCRVYVLMFHTIDFSRGNGSFTHNKRKQYIGFLSLENSSFQIRKFPCQPRVIIHRKTVSRLFEFIWCWSQLVEFNELLQVSHSWASHHMKIVTVLVYESCVRKQTQQREPTERRTKNEKVYKVDPKPHGN